MGAILDDFDRTSTTFSTSMISKGSLITCFCSSNRDRFSTPVPLCVSDESLRTKKQIWLSTSARSRPYQRLCSINRVLWFLKEQIHETLRMGAKVCYAVV